MSKSLESLKGQHTITQDNSLVSASYTLSLNEKRLLMLALSKVDPLSKIWLDGQRITIHASDLSEQFKIDKKKAYGVLRDALDKLYNRSVRIQGDHENGEEIRWLSAKKYQTGEGVVALAFGREMVHLLSGMVDYFTSYKILAVSEFKSIHSIRIYELASQFVSTGWRVIPLDDFRSMLQVDYPVWQNFKTRILDVACKKISEKSDITLSYTLIKKGCTVHAVKIFVEKKGQYQILLM